LDLATNGFAETNSVLPATYPLWRRQAAVSLHDKALIKFVAALVGGLCTAPILIVFSATQAICQSLADLAIPASHSGFRVLTMLIIDAVPATVTAARRAAPWTLAELCAAHGVWLGADAVRPARLASDRIFAGLLCNGQTTIGFFLATLLPRKAAAPGVETTLTTADRTELAEIFTTRAFDSISRDLTIRAHVATHHH